MARPINTEGAKVGQSQEHIVPSTGSIDRDDFQDEFEVMGTASLDSIKDTLFMEEEIEVMLNPGIATDEQAVQVSVNGVNQWFIRGLHQTVKRKFVNVLAGSKTEIIATPEHVDVTGAKATKIQKTYVPKYTFTILRDNNRNSQGWIEAALREG